MWEVPHWFCVVDELWIALRPVNWQNFKRVRIFIELINLIITQGKIANALRIDGVQWILDYLLFVWLFIISSKRISRNFSSFCPVHWLRRYYCCCCRWLASFATAPLVLFISLGNKVFVFGRVKIACNQWSTATVCVCVDGAINFDELSQIKLMKIFNDSKY